MQRAAINGSSRRQGKVTPVHSLYSIEGKFVSFRSIYYKVDAGG